MAAGGFPQALFEFVQSLDRWKRIWLRAIAGGTREWYRVQVGSDSSSREVVEKDALARGRARRNVNPPCQGSQGLKQFSTSSLRDTMGTATASSMASYEMCGLARRD